MDSFEKESVPWIKIAILFLKPTRKMSSTLPNALLVNVFDICKNKSDIVQSRYDISVVDCGAMSHLRFHF